MNVRRAALPTIVGLAVMAVPAVAAAQLGTSSLVSGGGWTAREAMAPLTPRLRAWLARRDVRLTAPIGRRGFFRNPIAPTVAVGGSPVGVAPALALHRFRPATAVRGQMLTARFGSRSALVGSAPVGNGPAVTATDTATHTLYVTNGFNENGNAIGGNTVSVIDTRHCQAQNVSRCKGPWPTITVGNQPSGIAIDEPTDTVYVSNINDNTVSVFNGATCNAENTSGCGQTPATVPVGMVPVAIFADPANHTIYIPNNADNDVSMLDSATCNATDLAACPTTPPPTAPVAANPVTGAVDQTTHTVYVTVCGDPRFGCSSGTTGLSVFDAATCNATVQSGCGELGTLTGDPTIPQSVAVDEAHHTLYTANGDNTVSAFDMQRCNADDLAGCATDAPGTMTFPGPGFAVTLWVTVDGPLHSLYVTAQKDDSLIVVDTNICNAAHLAACATLSPPTIHTGADPEIVSLDPATQTLYTANQLDNDVSVIDPTRCDAQTTTGCRHLPPEVPISTSGLAADPGVATIYAPSGANTVSMINTTHCNASHSSGCSQTPPTVTVGAFPHAIAVNPATHTMYVADSGSGSTGAITVFDDRTCNATQQLGCSTVSTMTVPDGNPVDIAVNPQTDTLYVATITSTGGPNLISVFNGATCNASNTSGCDQTPANASTGESTDSVAVNPSTNSIYTASDTDGPDFFGHTVYMIDGTTCDAANTTGCSNPPQTILLASDPRFGDPTPVGIAVNQRTDTIYTANIFDGEGPGSVSIINGAVCNSQNKTGCDQTPPTAPAGFGANAIAVDPTTNHIYATNDEDTSVTTINGNSCNGTNAAGCDHARTQATVGDYPGSIALDPHVGTAYVQAFAGVSVIPLNQRHR